MGKAHKIVALVRQRDSSSSPTISATRESSSGRALGATPKGLAPVSLCLDKKNITEVSPNTAGQVGVVTAARKQVQTSLLREQFHLAQQQQRNTAQREFLSLPRCTMNAANTANTETKDTLAKDMGKEPKKVKELVSHKESMKEKDTNASKLSPSQNKGTRLLQLSWWRKLSEDETSRLKNLPEHQKPLYDSVARYVMESRKQEKHFSTSNKGSKAVQEFTQMQQNSPSMKETNVTSTTTATDTIDLKGLYKRAFTVRRGELAMKRRWKDAASKTSRDTKEGAIHINDVSLAKDHLILQPAQVCSRAVVSLQKGQEVNMRLERKQHQEPDATKRFQNQKGTPWTRLFLIVCLLLGMILLFAFLWVDNDIISVKHVNQYYTVATHYYNVIITSDGEQPIL